LTAGPDLVVNGNPEVKGTQTIVNTSTLSVEDNIIELNRNISSQTLACPVTRD
jgi:hypothetical protein